MIIRDIHQANSGREVRRGWLDIVVNTRKHERERRNVGEDAEGDNLVCQLEKVDETCDEEGNG